MAAQAAIEDERVSKKAEELATAALKRKGTRKPSLAEVKQMAKRPAVLKIAREHLRFLDAQSKRL